MSQQEHVGGGVEEGLDALDACLKILFQPPVAIDPGEEPLDESSLGDHGEADLVVGRPDHLDADRAGIRNPSAGIAAICVAQRHERSSGPAPSRS